MHPFAFLATLLALAPALAATPAGCEDPVECLRAAVRAGAEGDASSALSICRDVLATFAIHAPERARDVRLARIEREAHFVCAAALRELGRPHEGAQHVLIATTEPRFAGLPLDAQRRAQAPPIERPGFNERSEFGMLFWALEHYSAGADQVMAVRLAGVLTDLYPELSVYAQCARILMQHFAPPPAITVQYLRHALTLSPGAVGLNWSLAQALLLRGDLVAGLAKYGQSCMQPDCPAQPISSVALPALFGAEGVESMHWATRTAESSRSSPPHLLGGVFQEGFLARLGTALGPRSAYWETVKHDFQSGQYFSFWYPFSERPRNILEQAVREVHSILPAADQRTVVGCEYWAHIRVPTTNSSVLMGHAMHFDEDEVHFQRTGKHTHPLHTAVLYLTDGIGGSTLVTNKSRADPTSRSLWVAPPALGHVLVFSGNMLHGVLPGLASGLDAEPSNKGVDPSDRVRITLNMAFWTQPCESHGTLDCVPRPNRSGTFPWEARDGISELAPGGSFREDSDAISVPLPYFPEGFVAELSAAESETGEVNNEGSTSSKNSSNSSSDNISSGAAGSRSGAQSKTRSSSGPGFVRTDVHSSLVQETESNVRATWAWETPLLLGKAWRTPPEDEDSGESRRYASIGELNAALVDEIREKQRQTPNSRFPYAAGDAWMTPPAEEFFGTGASESEGALQGSSMDHGQEDGPQAAIKSHLTGAARTYFQLHNIALAPGTHPRIGRAYALVVPAGTAVLPFWDMPRAPFRKGVPADPDAPKLGDSIVGVYCVQDVGGYDEVILNDPRGQLPRTAPLPRFMDPPEPFRWMYRASDLILFPSATPRSLGRVGGSGSSGEGSDRIFLVFEIDVASVGPDSFPSLAATFAYLEPVRRWGTPLGVALQASHTFGSSAGPSIVENGGGGRGGGGRRRNGSASAAELHAFLAQEWTRIHGPLLKLKSGVRVLPNVLAGGGTGATARSAGTGSTAEAGLRLLEQLREDIYMTVFRFLHQTPSPRFLFGQRFEENVRHMMSALMRGTLQVNITSSAANLDCRVGKVPLGVLGRGLEDSSPPDALRGFIVVAAATAEGVGSKESEATVHFLRPVGAAGAADYLVQRLVTNHIYIYPSFLDVELEPAPSSAPRAEESGNDTGTAACGGVVIEFWVRVTHVLSTSPPPQQQQRGDGGENERDSGPSVHMDLSLALPAGERARVQAADILAAHEAWEAQRRADALKRTMRDEL